MLPPALRMVDGDVRVTVYYSSENVSVGCAPTHPDVEVELERLDDNSPHYDWSYSPYVGIYLKRVDSWGMKGFRHLCIASLTNREGRKISMKSEPFKIFVKGQFN